MTQIEKLSKELPFLEIITESKEGLDKYRPLSKELEQKVFQKLRLDWNYNSNAIEGNVFTYGETIALLMEGITAKGKPLKDALDIKGHNDAINFMLDMIHDNRELNETDIRSLHKMVLGESYYKEAKTADGKPTRKLINVGQYKTEPNHVRTATGEIHYYASPEETPAKMQELLAWYNNTIEKETFHPVVLASLFHHKFVAIHPFDDGNGRMTRILTNFILLKFGYPVSVIKQERKQEYYACLSQADRGEVIPVIEYIGESVQHSLEIYFKAINGEDINEPDDIDKEIALFRQEIGVKLKVSKRKSDVDIVEISQQIFSSIKSKLDKFKDLFLKKEETVFLLYPEMRYSIDDNFIHKKKLYETSISRNMKKRSRNVIHYDYKLKKDIYGKNIELTKVVSIEFFDDNYFIFFGKRKLIKYYDENIIDESFFKELKIFIEEIMKILKNLPKK